MMMILPQPQGQNITHVTVKLKVGEQISEADTMGKSIKKFGKKEKCMQRMDV